MDIIFRKVCMEDCKLVFEWINDPLVRKMSFSEGPVSLNEHKQWFVTKIRDPLNYYFIAETGSNTPVGQVRFEISTDIAEISLLVAPDYRGKGFGEKIISLSSQKIFRETPVKQVHAYIKPQNTASLKAFTKAGFLFRDLCNKNGNEACHMILER